MSASKKSKKKVSHPALIPNAVIASVADPPSASVPKPPIGFDPNTMVVGKGTGRALAAVVASAAALSAEILASPTFTQDFGTKVPAPELSGLLTKAVGWRAQRNDAERRADDVKYGDAQTWSVVKWELERFRKIYEGAVACDASIAGRFPVLAAVFAAMSAPGLKAGATRKKKAQTSTQAPVPATAPVAAAPATPAAVHPATPSAG